MIVREAEKRLRSLAAAFRSVAVVGPRQSGKTTLCRMVFPDKPYVSMENPDTLAFATEDPKGFLAQYSKGAIIDEAQKAPHLFSFLQQILDETNRRGLFILTGSNNFLLQESIGQSLAGRIGYLQLLPLTLNELKDAKKLPKTLEQTIILGGYPEVQAVSKLKPQDFYPNYLSTYVERDVKLISNISNHALFLKFVKLCAGRIGGILNYSSIANDCGIDQKTAAQWMHLLEMSFIVYLLKPYHNNYNKRLIKSPKLYFTDTGLAAYLLGLSSARHLALHPLKGHLVENLLIMDLLKRRLNKGKPDVLYFWRDKTGNEVDLLIDEPTTIKAVEIKAGNTVAADFFKGLSYYTAIEQKPVKQYLFYGGAEAQKRSNGPWILPWSQTDEV